MNLIYGLKRYILTRFLPFTATIASVDEGVPLGTTIAFITVTDLDSSRDSEASVSLTFIDGNMLSHFELIEISNLDSWALRVSMFS